MTEITKISSKGQVVIPFGIRKDLGLDVGTALAVSRADGIILLKKLDIPDPKEEFKKLTKWGRDFAKKKGLKQENMESIIHKGRGIPGA
ncbi:MAG TPA: AbrB/MazE/SpoVT family DNA-binding domain-containing protein [Candidatus Nanoarchaeia archaeon]|nr:AbrB/MazE/SpoVT family DNA-binding domain-containing protein [Candidatus Nanoarchaeia archaeon]